MAREWSEKQRALMRWLSLPGDDLMGEGKGLRQPKTLKALAEHLKVSRETLYEWQKLPGWDEAYGVMAGRVFRSLKPEFLRTFSAGLLKAGSAGYDRLVTALVRYVDPAMNDQEELERWEQILPEATADKKGATEQLMQEELRQLPMAEREIVINFYQRVAALESNGEVLTERESYQVKRMVTEAHEEEEAKQLEKEQEQESNIIEGLVLAGPGATVVAEPVQNRYDPGRGLRKQQRSSRPRLG